jgi:hypothetical protein
MAVSHRACVWPEHATGLTWSSRGFLRGLFQRLLPLTRHLYAPRYWKATLRSAPLLAFVLLGQWHQEIRIFRWKWLANAAARRHRRATTNGRITDAIVEPYWPGDNVISLQPISRDR